MAEETKAPDVVAPPPAEDDDPSTLYVPWNTTDEADRAAVAEAAAFIADAADGATHAAVYRFGLVVPVNHGDADPTSYPDAADAAVAACQYGTKPVTSPVFAGLRAGVADYLRTTIDAVDADISDQWGTDLHTTAARGRFLDAVRDDTGAVSADSTTGKLGGATWAAELVNTMAAANKTLNDVLVAAVTEGNPNKLPPVPEDAAEDTAGDAKVDDTTAVDEPAPAFEFPDDDMPLWTAPPTTDVRVEDGDVALWHAWVAHRLAHTEGRLKFIQGGRVVAVALATKDGAPNPLARLAAVVRRSSLACDDAMVGAALADGDPNPLARHIMLRAVLTDAVLKPAIDVCRLPAGMVA